MIRAEKFNAEEWAELFRKAGAKFAGPVTEHADGFSTWDSKVNPWTAARMGPRRDVVGEMSRAIRNEGMKFIATLHHQWLWGWYPTMDKSVDASNSKYAGLYGPPTPGSPYDYGKPWSTLALPIRSIRTSQWFAIIAEHTRRAGVVGYLEITPIDRLIRLGEAGRLEICRRLGWNAVPSNSFTERGSTQPVLLEGNGQGHGIGFCQQGAGSMAAAGADFRKILDHYYPNAALISVHPQY